jgi:sulfur-oxidizing protein SoxB
MNRREFIQFLLAGYAAGIVRPSFGSTSVVYDFKPFGNLRLIHITDTHAQLDPMYFREPNFNLGVGSNRNMPPHIIGKKLLDYYSIDSTLLKHAYTHLEFNKHARKYGKFGGYTHLKTLIDLLKSQVNNNALLLDGGDTWQGSGLSYLENGRDMVAASNLLGVDVMTGHWEFTFGEKIFLENLKIFNGDFVAQNISLTEEALFEGLEPVDEDNHFQKPYIIKSINGSRVAVIGQSFPYTPIANPKRFIPNLTFGIKDSELQKLVNHIKNKENPLVIVLLSHNGVDVDKKMASKISGIDIILGGHTHDVLPKPIVVKNTNNSTLVLNSGCNGKFVSVLDLKIKGKSFSYKYKLLPVLSNQIKASKEMDILINNFKDPHREHLDEVIGKSSLDLYRRGNFNGSFDNLICDSLTNVLDSEISLSPGFRWGPTILANEDIRMSDIYNHTAITYPNVYRRELSGQDIKNILEDVADNIFNPDPYLQQGGDMVRTTGLSYEISPKNNINQRITNIRTNDGKLLNNNKKYMVSGWASVNSEEVGEPIWDITRQYLSDIKYYDLTEVKQPKILQEGDNFGIET